MLQDLGEFEGACLGAQSLDALRRNLDARLLGLGLVTSQVNFVPQNLAQGLLLVRLNLGRVARIERRGAAAAVANNAVAFDAGDVLNLRTIEQTLENLARLPSQAAQFQIEPGESPGTSVVVITGSAPDSAARAWRIGAGIDNAAARDYGQWQASAQWAWDAPLGLSDQLTLNANRSLRNQRGDRFQEGVFVAYSLPMGSHLLSASASYHRHARPVQGLSTRFSANGFDASEQLRWQWAGFRTASTRWHFWAGATQRRSRSAVDDVELVLQRRNSRSLDWGFNNWTRFPMGELRIEFDAARSVRLAPYADLQLDPPPLARSQRAHVSWTQPVGKLAIYESRLSWAGVRQAASGADLQTLGSRWGVRGFDGQAYISGRELLTWRQDLRFAPLNASRWMPMPWQWHPYLGLDFGRIGAASAPGHGDRPALAGAALGLRWGKPGFGGDFTLAMPLHQPQGFGASAAVFYTAVNFNY